MYTRESAIERINRFFGTVANADALIASSGRTAEEIAEDLDAMDQQIMAEFEVIKRDKPELLQVTDSERAEIEKSAQERGTCFERELAGRVVMKERISAGFRKMRAQGKKLKKSDFEGQDMLPFGLDDVVPPDLIDDEVKNW